MPHLAKLQAEPEKMPQGPKGPTEPKEPMGPKGRNDAGIPHMATEPEALQQHSVCGRVQAIASTKLPSHA